MRRSLALVSTAFLGFGSAMLLEGCINDVFCGEILEDAPMGVYAVDRGLHSLDAEAMTIEKAGSMDDDALWVRCPKCEVPLEVLLRTPDP